MGTMSIGCESGDASTDLEVARRATDNQDPAAGARTPRELASEPGSRVVASLNGAPSPELLNDARDLARQWRSEFKDDPLVEIEFLDTLEGTEPPSQDELQAWLEEQSALPQTPDVEDSSPDGVDEIEAASVITGNHFRLKIPRARIKRIQDKAAKAANDLGLTKHGVGFVDPSARSEAFSPAALYSNGTITLPARYAANAAVTGTPYRWIGRVEHPTAGTAGSASLYGPRHYFSVAHTIIWDSDNDGDWEIISQARFRPGFNGSATTVQAPISWAYWETACAPGNCVAERDFVWGLTSTRPGDATGSFLVATVNDTDASNKVISVAGVSCDGIFRANPANTDCDVGDYWSAESTNYSRGYRSRCEAVACMSGSPLWFGTSIFYTFGAHQGRHYGSDRVAHGPKLTPNRAGWMLEVKNANP